MNREIKFSIDGIVCRASEETTVVEQAVRCGVSIPTLCADPAVTPSGSCRVCIVEIEGEGLAAACTLSPSDGMQIKTDTDIVRASRRATIGLLLQRAPHSTRLHELADEYGCSAEDTLSREFYEELEVCAPQTAECILCGLCVRACAQYGKETLQFSGRGMTRTVRHFSSFACSHCNRCLKICPTGAITTVLKIHASQEGSEVRSEEGS